ncbi:MAG: type II toxin-antitoxin system RelE/ParE family toxin [Acidobacteriota bacterium]|nr:type II toxin-antitoxin system RelE/ParE family toxin [Acidobacteriota bacterium]
MPACVLSKLARADLIGIADYTVDTWGEAQALRYLSQIEEALDRLEKNPRIGRRCDPIRRGYRRHEVGEHVLFYLIRKEEVFISRILHGSMLPTRVRLIDS